ncbi:MAG TPA: acetyltransferase, partial [Fibrobacteria bacterium]|nr:acetyltransferase [Fibrobacteria bacterium]
MTSFPDPLRPASPAGPLVFVFNGDADGLCAQHILALEEGVPAARVTGWKRDIRLLARLPDLPRGARLRVCDISLDANRDALPPLLHREDIDIVWYDHHEPGEPLAHPRLRVHVNTSPGLCSAAIVDQVHGRGHRDWAALGAYGDNLPAVAEGLLRDLGAHPSGWPALERAGLLLNYNAYGDRPGDVLFEPADLALRMEPFTSAAAFAAERSLFDSLEAQHDSDRERFQGLSPLVAGPNAKAFLVPDEPWA